MTTATLVKVEKASEIFGELNANATATQSLYDLDQENLLTPIQTLVFTKSGQPIVISIHDIFLTKKSEESRNVDVKFIISMTIDQHDNKKEAFFQANSIFNEETIEFDEFFLESYENDVFDFKVNGFSINWNEWLHHEVC